MKRIFLFVLTNILIMATISIVLNVLGVRPYLTANGIDYQSLMIFCLVWGMGGAFISLLLSRWMAKMMMGVKVIDPQNPGEYAWLYNMVAQVSRAASLNAVPQVGIFENPMPNAFATGPSQNRALVAFSTGILQQMDREELEGVTAHEIAHIKNGDMVTMTLLQGIVNAFVMFFARIIAFAVSSSAKEESRPLINMLVTIVLEIALSFLGMIVVAWFSRQREFRADAGAGSMVGRGKMIAALEKLRRFQGAQFHGDASEEHASIAALQISGKSGGLMSLFATHPPLETRIAALQNRTLSSPNYSAAA